MEKRRLALVYALNFLCRDEKSDSLFAYQLGMFFITRLSRSQVNSEMVQWIYPTLDELAEEFAVFLMKPMVQSGQLHEALERLQKLDFIEIDREDPTPEEVAAGVRNKLHWGITIGINLLCDFKEQIQACYDEEDG